MLTKSRPVLGRIGGQLLAAFVLLSLVPVAVTNLVGYLSSRGAYRSLVQENIAKTAQVQAFELEDYISGLGAVLGATATGLGHQISGGQDLAPQLRAVVDHHEALEALTLLDPRGRPLAASHADWARAEVCAAAVGATGRRVERLPESGEEDPLIALSVPVRDGDDTLVGSLCGRFSFAVHQRLLTARTHAYVDGLIYIVDNHGEVVCGSFHSHEPHVAAGHHLAPDLAGLAEVGALWSGTIDGHDFAAYAPAPGLDWGVLVDVPEELATAPLERLKRRAQIFGLLLALALVVFVTTLARRLVQPLYALVDAASRIAGGRYGETVPVRGNDELTRLAEEFNRMSGELDASYRELDERVASRTRELEESHDFVDLILDSVDHRITVLNRDLRVLKANEATRRRFGDDVVGRLCHEVFEDRPTPCEGCPALAAVSEGRRIASERGVANDELGEVLSVEAFPVPGAVGPPDNIVVVARVITEEKRLQAQLVHQEKMSAFGQLAAGLAHEIGNPLASISSELEIMELEPDAGSSAASLPVLREQVQRVARLLRSLTDFSRKEEHGAAVVPAGELVEDVLRLVRSDPRCRGVAVTSDLGDVPAIACRRDPLIQMLLNLCLNALDALGGRGTLRVGASATAEVVELTVEDDGPGIEPRLLDRIFDPFFTTKPPGRGTGLGLFVTRRIAADLGGAIRVESRPGRTLFVLQLPAWQEVEE